MPGTSGHRPCSRCQNRDVTLNLEDLEIRSNLLALAFVAFATPATASPTQDQPLICFGNEPFWRLDLTKPGAARFSTPDSPEAVFIGAMQHHALSNTAWDIVRGMLDMHRTDGERVLTAHEVSE